MNTQEAINVLANGGKIKQIGWAKGKFLTCKDGEILNESNQVTSIGGYPPGVTWVEDLEMTTLYHFYYRNKSTAKPNPNRWQGTRDLYKDLGAAQYSLGSKSSRDWFIGEPVEMPA